MPDLGDVECTAEGLPEPNLLDTAAESMGDTPPALHVDLNSTCDGLSLSAPDSEQSTGKDNRQAPG